MDQPCTIPITFIVLHTPAKKLLFCKVSNVLDGWVAFIVFLPRPRNVRSPILSYSLRITVRGPRSGHAVLRSGCADIAKNQCFQWFYMVCGARHCLIYFLTRTAICRKSIFPYGFQCFLYNCTRYVFLDTPKTIIFTKFFKAFVCLWFF